MKNIIFKYVICFPKKDNKILMIYRHKNPWFNHWNGIGGRIEENETPFDAIYREVMEESELEIKDAEFSGIVSWDAKVETKNENDNFKIGMYSFIFDLKENEKIWKNEKRIDEGILAWKSIDWVCNPENKEVAHNVPYFLTEMLKQKNPMEYYCKFDKEKFTGIEILEFKEKYMI